MAFICKDCCPKHKRDNNKKEYNAEKNIPVNINIAQKH